MHEEIVHGPVGLDATLAYKAGELSVMANAVEQRVEEDGFAVGVERARSAGDEVDRFAPVDSEAKSC